MNTQSISPTPSNGPALVSSAPATSIARRVIIPIAGGLALALLYGWIAAWRGQGAFWPTLLVQAAVTTPLFAIGVRLFVTDRGRTNTQIDRHAHDVERQWSMNAAATSFYVLVSGLVLAETLGDVLRIAWLSPVTLDHVLVLGLGSFALCYLYERRRAH